ncbi:MAG: hypothetical protein WCF16_12825 [Alphaproteobacteria bacterium]
MGTRGKHGAERLCLAALMLCAAAGLAACAASLPDPRSYLRQHGVDDPRPGWYRVCYNFGCRSSADIALTGKEWDRLRAVFEPPAGDAQQERARISKAIGLMEKLTSTRLGTGADLGGTFTGMGLAYQMDCVDETVNTTTYLTMIEKDGLLRWHRLAGPAGRGVFFDSWPHQTAVVVETATDKYFAVDSWFFDDGHPATVVPLDLWKSGYAPPGGADG